MNPCAIRLQTRVFAVLCMVLALSALIHAQDASNSVSSGGGLFVAGVDLLYTQNTVAGYVDEVALLKVTNQGQDADNVGVLITSRNGAVEVLAGQANFGHIAAGTSVTSDNAIVFRQAAGSKFDPSMLQVVFGSSFSSTPRAQAGRNQYVKIGEVVRLTGAESTNPSGQPLTYLWNLQTKPEGSSASLETPSGVNVSFTPDVAGLYVAQLVVHDSTGASQMASVTIGVSVPPAPNASASAIEQAGKHSPLLFSGVGSSDPGGLALSYEWTLLSDPSSTPSLLAGANLPLASLPHDGKGGYSVQLVVDNGSQKSAPATLNVERPFSRPTAKAGSAQKVPVGATVHLDGSRSTDPQGHRLSYQWALLTRPDGSAAVLLHPSSIRPTVVADVEGVYVAQLTVHNGSRSSEPSTVLIDTGIVAPTANPGPNQLVTAGTIAQLDGSGSTDLNGLMLSFQWTLTSIPTGSAATLSSATAIRPVFTVDLPGTYIAQLIVSDSNLASAPAQVIVSTTAIPPVATAGPAQSISTGTLVSLNGSGSTDPNGLPLSYAWSLIAVPQGSQASLQNANTATPSFTADLAGNYVAQLIVSDSDYSSAPATVLVSTGDLPPIANAGSSVSTSPGTVVTLNGGNSSDPQGLPLTYSWTFTSIPSGSAAVLNNPTSVTPNFTADLSGLYVVQLIVNDGVQSSLPVTVVIDGLFPAAVTVSLTNSNLITYSSSTGDVHISNPATNTGGTGCNGQVINISLDQGNLGTLSTPTSNPSTNVCIPVGLQDAPFTLTTNGNTGSTTLSGFQDDFQTGTTSVSVNLRQINMSFDNVNVGQGRVANGTITLSDPAPTGGVTIDLSSSSPLVASVSTASVTIAAGATTATFQVNALTAGTSTITATAEVAGYTTPATVITVFSSGQTISIPRGFVVGPGQTLSFPVSIGAAATSPVTITLTSSGGPGTVTFSPSSVTIPTGATTPPTQPTITGGAIGSVTVTASAPSYASDVEPVTVSITLTLNPTSVTVLTSATATLTLTASETAGSGGLVVPLSTNPTGIASVPASVTIPSGSSKTQVTVTGVAGGATTLTAGGTGFVNATASVTVNQAPLISFYICPTAMGKNASSNYYPYNSYCYPVLGAPAPAGGLNVTVTSSSSNLTLTLNPATTGTKSVTLSYAGGSTTPSAVLYLAALAGTGSANITATAKGYTSAVQTVSLTPSGFTVSGGTTTTVGSAPSTVSVNFSGLDPSSLSATNYPPLRPGAASVTVTMKNDNTVVGTLGASSLTISSGNEYNSTTYTPLAPGTSNISITTPTGYTTPSSGTTTQFVVSTPPISFYICPTTMGKNTSSNYYPYNSYCYPVLGAPAPAGGLNVTVTSSSSNLTLTLNPATTGTKSVTLSYAGGSTTPSAVLYLAALAGTGSANITATAKGYTSAVQTVSLTPSGFTVSGGTTTTVGSAPSTVSVNFAGLDPSSLSATNYPPLRPGAASVTVTLKNNNTAVGTLGASSVVISSGNEYNSTTYTPLAPGTSNISVTTPTGYTTPSSGTTTQFVVSTPPISFYICPTAMGKNASSNYYPYNSYCYPVLGAPAPAGGLNVTVTSSSSNLTLTLNPATTGTKSVTLNYAGGSTTPSAVLYLAALAGTGSANITATAKGYTSAVQTVSLTPSGFTVSGGTTTTVGSAPSTVSVNFAGLDPSSLSATNYPPLRPGAASVTVTMKNDNTAAGTLGASSLTISSGNEYNSTTYTPLAPGTSNVSITTPTGYTTPSSGTTTQFVVSTPPISFYICPTTMGKNASSNYYPYNSYCYPVLGAPAPAGGLNVTVTSSDPALATLTLNPATTGSQSVTLNYAAGSTTPSNVVYIAALNSSGSPTITATAPGYTSASYSLSLTPSGFVISGGTNTTVGSAPSAVSVDFAALDPTSLTATNYPPLRPGAAPVTVNLSNDNTVAGALGANSLVITTGNESNSTTYTPLAAGTSNISISSTPPGYTKPFSGTTTQFVVTTPPISFYICPTTMGKNASSNYYPYNAYCYPVLGAPAPAGGVSVTVTSSDPTLATLTLNPTTTGTQSVTLNYSAGNTTPNNVLYLAAFKSTGTPTITATAPGYTSASFSVSLTPSGFIVTGGTTTTNLSTSTPVTVEFVALDPTSLNATNYPPLRPGAPSVTVNLKNDNTAAGTLGANSVIITAGNGSAATTYTPLAVGTSNISISSTPPGYTKPFTGTTTQFVVTAASGTVQPVTIGQNLMTTTYGQLATGVTTDNSVVTISVADSSQLLLSYTGQDSGQSSLTFTFSQGQTTTPQFYVYALGTPGTATLNLTAPDNVSGSGTVTIDPSGFTFINQNFTTTLGAAATTIYIQPAALDPVYLSQVAVQQLRPGTTNTQVTVTLTDQPSQGGGSSKVGSITLNPVVFNGADNPNYQITSFEPIGVGQTLLQLTSPGFSQWSSGVTATVQQ